MARSLGFLLLLTLLAAASGLAFTAAAAQAAAPPPLILAAKDSSAAASGAASKPTEGANAIAAGENIGDIVKSWGTALLLGVAGLMGLAAIGKRSVGEGITLLVIVVIVGGFVFAPEQVKGFIQSVWSPLSA